MPNLVERRGNPAERLPQQQELVALQTVTLAELHLLGQRLALVAGLQMRQRAAALVAVHRPLLRRLTAATAQQIHLSAHSPLAAVDRLLPTEGLLRQRRLERLPV